MTEPNGEHERDDVRRPGLLGPPPRPMGLRHVRARLAGLGLILLAGWEVMVLVSARQSEPTREEWQAAAAAIPPTLAADQLIVFAPGWIDPVGRQWLGGRMSVEQVARMDAERYREIWEVSIRGASAPEVGAAAAVSEQDFGPIRVRRFQREAPAVTWSLSDGTRICEVDFTPRRGLVLDLSHRYAQARRAFDGVELGNELQVYVGLGNFQKRARNRSTAMVQAMVDGREVTRGFAGNDGGWVALPIAVTPPGVHDVEIVARVQDPRGPVDLSVCVAAEARTRPR
jgi:hypothetical protein